MSDATITTSPISAVVAGNTVSASVTSSSVASSVPGTAAGVASVNNLAGALTLAAVGATWSSTGSTLTLTVSGGGGGGASTWDNLTGKPSTFTPAAHAASHAANGTDALTLSASQVSGLATVATSGSYADLSNKPTIPAATTSASDLTSGTLAEARLPDAVRNTPHPFMLMGG